MKGGAGDLCFLVTLFDFLNCVHVCLIKNINFKKILLTECFPYSVYTSLRHSEFPGVLTTLSFGDIVTRMLFEEVMISSSSSG